MLISIIVPAYNEAKLLSRTLAAIATAAQVWTRRGWTHELIVCDNNSSDGTAEIARAHGALVVFEPINQIARARNRGASVAQGRWLLFIDADSLPSAALLDDLANAIASDRHLACGATFAFDDGAAWLRFVGACWGAWSRLLRHMAGSFVAVETQAFREVGGFPEELFAGEEVELSRRLKAVGRDRSPPQSVKILSHHPPADLRPKSPALQLRRNVSFCPALHTESVARRPLPRPLRPLV